MYLGDSKCDVHLFSSQLTWIKCLYRRYPTQKSPLLATMSIKSDLGHLQSDSTCLHWEEKDEIWRWCFELVTDKPHSITFNFDKSKTGTQYSISTFQRTKPDNAFCGRKENLNPIHFSKPWITSDFIFNVFIFAITLYISEPHSVFNLKSYSSISAGI